MYKDQTDFSEVKEWEVQDDLKEMKNGKAPGRSSITVDLLRERKKPLILTILLNACPQQVKFQRNRMLRISLLYKRGNMADLSNYGPIILLETTYKILSKVNTRRITSTLDHIKPGEQVDFR